MKLVQDSELNMDAGDVTAREVILFPSILEQFFNFIGTDCNFNDLVYTRVVYR